MIRGEEKYRKKDMPVPATFLSSIKEHQLFLESSESKIGPDNTVQRVPNTGLRVGFEDYRALIWNKAVLDKMVLHPDFNATRFGFTIDMEDPNGFWRAQGVVEEEVIIRYKPKATFAVDVEKLSVEKLKDIDPKTLPDLSMADKG